MLKAKARIGRLDEQITLQRATQSTDAYGGPTVTFSTIETVMAGVEYAIAGSGEDYDGPVNLVASRIVFTMHYRTDVNEQTRIVWNGRNYDVIRNEHDGRGLFTRLTAEYKA